MKRILIVIALIILIPLVVVGGLYLLVPPFQDLVNESLRYAPGGVGEFFNSRPTDEELDEQLAQIAAYLLSVEQDRAIDKINVIKAEDDAAYQRLINAMVRLEPNKTERILKQMREQSLQDSVVLNTLDQINEEQIAYTQNRAAFIDSLNRLRAIEEIKQLLDEAIDAHQQIAAIFTNLSDEKVIAITEYLYPEDVAEIYSYLPDERVFSLKTTQGKQTNRQREISAAAEMLKAKDAQSLALIIGNQDSYQMSELAQIYQILGPKLAGEVLSYVNEDSFTTELTKAIAQQQRLAYGADDFSADLYKSLNIYREYDDNLTELVKIYQNIEFDKTADIVRRLYWNTDNEKTYQLSNGDAITISDEQLALDLLQSFEEEDIANILTNLDNNISTEISTKLALPDLD